MRTAFKIILAVLLIPIGCLSVSFGYYMLDKFLVYKQAEIIEQSIKSGDSRKEVYARIRQIGNPKITQMPGGCSKNATNHSSEGIWVRRYFTGIINVAWFACFDEDEKLIELRPFYRD